jgi:hypothetical protein
LGAPFLIFRSGKDQVETASGRPDWFARVSREFEGGRALFPFHFMELPLFLGLCAGFFS